MSTKRKAFDTSNHDFLSAIVFFAGFSQGLLPLVMKLIFDAERKFSPSGYLSAPWWWIACLAIIVIATALLAVIDQDKVRRIERAETAETHDEK